MAEDHTQRPFRSTDTHSRATPTANNPAAANDPLAELARLIGQSDPFGEFGRDSAPQPAAPPPQAPNQPEPMLRALAAQTMPHGANPAQAAGEHGAEFPTEGYARQPYGSPPLAGGDDVYHMQDAPVPGYEDHAGYQEAGYEQPGPPPYAGEEHGYQDYYDDIPPPRRRMGVLAIAAVFALAVIGTAGAFGYRALFGSVSSGPPPVIKADSKPAKIVPDKDKSQSAKLINDRVNNGGGDQKLVSREEQPVDLNKDKVAGVITQGQSMANAGAGSMQTPALGSGVIGSDPRKVHTITIRPDQPLTQQAGAPGSSMPADQASMADVTPAAPPPTSKPAQPLAPAQPATHEARQPTPTPRRTVTHRVAPATHRVASVPASNAPLSLTPDAVAPARTASRAPRVARAPTSLTPESSARPASSASGGYAVQVSSRRSEADARAALSRTQSRFASVVGGQRVMVKRVDLGSSKGVYYRAMIGPFGSSAEASRLCSRLKAAGGSCFVQKI